MRSHTVVHLRAKHAVLLKAPHHVVEDPVVADADGGFVIVGVFGKLPVERKIGEPNDFVVDFHGVRTVLFRLIVVLLIFCRNPRMRDQIIGLAVLIALKSGVRETNVEDIQPKRRELAGHVDGR